MGKNSRKSTHAPDPNNPGPGNNEDQTAAMGLIQRAQNQDEQAQIELYQRSYSLVYGKIHAQISDEETVQDLVQDTYAEAFAHLGQLHCPKAFPSWILTIARLRTVDWYRKQAKQRAIGRLAAADRIEEYIPSGDLRPELHPDYLPQEALDAAETKRLLAEILDTLPEKQHRVVVMRYYNQMKIPEIARILNLSPNTVKTLLRRGEKKVKEQVLDLERRGTKLYGLPPILFVLLLLERQKTRGSPDSRWIEPEPCAGDPTDPENPISADSGNPEGSGDASDPLPAGAATANRSVSRALFRKLAVFLIALTLCSGAGIVGFNMTHSSQLQTADGGEPAGLEATEDPDRDQSIRTMMLASDSELPGEPARERSVTSLASYRAAEGPGSSAGTVPAEVPDNPASGMVSRMSQTVSSTALQPPDGVPSAAPVRTDAFRFTALVPGEPAAVLEVPEWNRQEVPWGDYCRVSALGRGRLFREDADAEPEPASFSPWDRIAGQLPSGSEQGNLRPEKEHNPKIGRYLSRNPSGGIRASPDPREFDPIQVLTESGQREELRRDREPVRAESVGVPAGLRMIRNPASVWRTGQADRPEAPFSSGDAPLDRLTTESARSTAQTAAFSPRFCSDNSSETEFCIPA